MNLTMTGGVTGAPVIGCLYDGVYSFTVRDNFGDGICCDNGFGSFRLSVADVHSRDEADSLDVATPLSVLNGSNFGFFAGIHFRLPYRASEQVWGPWTEPEGGGNGVVTVRLL